MNKLLLVAAISAILSTSAAFARNDDGKNGNDCVNNCGKGNAGGDVTDPVDTPDAVGTDVIVTVPSSESAEMQQGIVVNNNNSSDYSGAYDKYVAPAYAPPLAATGDCLGSASAGGSGATFGLSLGKTYVDEGCNARRDSIHLAELAKLYNNDALATASVHRLCSQPEMRKVIPTCPVVEEETDSRWWVE